MNNKILRLLEKTVPQLVFALLSGLAYFAVIYELLVRSFDNGGGLIVFFFAPLIICGAALVLIKLFKQSREAENDGTIVALFWLHILLMLIAAVMTAAALIG